MSLDLKPIPPIASNFLTANTETGARICVINIMDNAASTERHFERTLLAAAPNAKITWCRMACAKTDPKYFREQDHLLSAKYSDWQNVIGLQDFDLVVFTGINRGDLSYADLARDYPDFWNETQELIEAIQTSIRHGKTGHVTYVCWSAFALMKHQYGVEKNIHPEKFYGLFPHQIAIPPHALVQGFEETSILVPQSRFSYMQVKDLTPVISGHDGEIVMNGPDGPAIWTLEDGRVTCFINHLEYSIDTLDKEYEWGKAKYGEGFKPPQNYTYNPSDPALQAVFETLGQSCSIFYKNLIALAQVQKSRAYIPDLAVEQQAEERKWVFGS